MIDLLFDTNIVIYLSKKEEKYLKWFEQLGEKIIGVSVVSVIESLVGVKDEFEYLHLWNNLMEFEVIPLEKEMAVRVAMMLRQHGQKNLKSLFAADFCIAETARFMKVPLVTNNSKDFRHWKDLKIIVP